MYVPNPFTNVSRINQTAFSLLIKPYINVRINVLKLSEVSALWTDGGELPWQPILMIIQMIIQMSIQTSIINSGAA